MIPEELGILIAARSLLPPPETCLGLLARIPYIAHIERRAQKHGHDLREPLGFKRNKPPVGTTISRILAKISLDDLQNHFAAFLNAILMKDNDMLTAAVDGCVAHGRLAPSREYTAVAHESTRHRSDCPTGREQSGRPPRTSTFSHTISKFILPAGRFAVTRRTNPAVSSNISANCSQCIRA